ncbi:MAG: hypothetical protein GC182_13335 [Rhodopseudomonas sp.]|nr:hypothetical protein [Rhodopseudomonas sp.]
MAEKHRTTAIFGTDIVNAMTFRLLLLLLLLTSFCGFSPPPSATPPQATLSGHHKLIMTQAAPVSPAGGWRLVRTPGPQNSGDVVSIMHTADTITSDPEFAGLLIRCRSNARLQIGFITITPFHPRSHPKVAVTAGSATTRFQGDVLPPGSLIALPNEAEALARGPWLSAAQLTVDIDGDNVKIHGVTSLEGLPAAISQLQASCP